MFEGYRRRPKRRRHFRASAKQVAVRKRFSAAIKACKAVKGKAKWSCVRKHMKRK
jgi:hypothetical protein